MTHLSERIGFVSAILHEASYEEVLEFASREKLGVELMMWPPGPPTRKFGGVRHVDAANLKASGAERLVNMAADKKVRLTGGGYYPNLLSGDPEEAKIALNQVYCVIDAVAMMNLRFFNTFVGADQHLSIEDNLTRAARVWPSILQYAKDAGVKVLIENCKMLFDHKQGPGGQNVMFSPKIWRRFFQMFQQFAGTIGLEFDPSHLVWLLINILKAAKDFMPDIHRVHAKDQKLYSDLMAEVGVGGYCLDYSEPVLPGDGDVPWVELFKVFMLAGYEGDFDIEVEEKGVSKGSLDERKQAVVKSRDFLLKAWDQAELELVAADGATELRKAIP